MVKGVAGAGAAVGVVLTLLAAGQDEPDLLKLGKEIYTSRCANCHFVPDSTIERDRVWLQLIKTTA